ncbi:hypothetical protein Tco_0033724 [Tanacetum coccineum]
MIACVEKTAQNADFYQIIDYLTGCSINYSLLVDPDLIGPWLQQFWTTASLKVINDVPHIRAMVAGKKILISEETIRADLLFDDANAQLTFSKPLFSPQWKYLVHVLLHCLSPKSTSWEQFGTNIASALVGLATNQKFNFSLMIMNGMLGHISNGTPFLMYPRFVQLFLNKQLEGVDRPQDFMPSVTLPSKIFTFMRKHSPKDAQGTPTQSAAQASISQGTADVQGTDNSQGTASLQGTAAIPTSPNDYTPTDASQTSGGDEGLLDFISFEHGKLGGSREQLFTQAKRLSAQGLSSRNYPIRLQQIVKHHGFSGKSNETEVLERKSDETEEINIEEKEASNVKSGDTEELDLETTQSTARQSTITPRTLNFEDEAEVCPEHSWFHTNLLKIKPGTGSKSKGKGILVKNPKKTKLNLTTIRALVNKYDEEVARKIQAEWDAEEERKRFEELKKAKPKTTLRVKPTSLAQERNKMMNFLKGQGYKNLQKLKLWLQERNAKRLSRKRKATISEEQPFKKLKLRTETVDEIRNYLRVVDFEKCAQERESLEGISMITELQVIDSPDGEYLIIHRGNNHFRAFDTLWEILHILDRQDLYHLYRVVQDYYEHIPPTGLGLILLGDLTTIWETPEYLWWMIMKNLEDWEIVSGRLNEPSGVHTLELRGHVAEKDNLFDAKTKNVQRSVYQEIAFKQIVNKMLLKDEA